MYQRVLAWGKGGVREVGGIYPSAIGTYSIVQSVSGQSITSPLLENPRSPLDDSFAVGYGVAGPVSNSPALPSPPLPSPAPLLITSGGFVSLGGHLPGSDPSVPEGPKPSERYSSREQTRDAHACLHDVFARCRLGKSQSVLVGNHSTHVNSVLDSQDGHGLPVSDQTDTGGFFGGFFFSWRNSRTAFGLGINFLVLWEIVHVSDIAVRITIACCLLLTFLGISHLSGVHEATAEDA